VRQVCLRHYILYSVLGVTITRCQGAWGRSGVLGIDGWLVSLPVSSTSDSSDRARSRAAALTRRRACLSHTDHRRSIDDICHPRNISAHPNILYTYQSHALFGDAISNTSSHRFLNLHIPKLHTSKLTRPKERPTASVASSPTRLPLQLTRQTELWPRSYTHRRLFDSHDSHEHGTGQCSPDYFWTPWVADYDCGLLRYMEVRCRCAVLRCLYGET
jgi:hypothetical protein